jgi:hypothetical protein
VAYFLQYAVEVCFVPDGAGPMSVPSMQKIVFRPAGWPGNSQVGGANGIQVPGGNGASQANFNQALSGATATPTAPSLSADIATQIAAKLGQIQGFATGGG